MFAIHSVNSAIQLKLKTALILNGKQPCLECCLSSWIQKPELLKLNSRTEMIHDFSPQKWGNECSRGLWHWWMCDCNEKHWKNEVLCTHHGKQTVSKAPLLVLFQRFPLSTGLYLSSVFCVVVWNHLCFVWILVGICQHAIQWEIISLSDFSLPLCICVLVSHLSFHLSLSLSLSLSVWPRSCSSIGLEVRNHPLMILLSQFLLGQTDPGIGKYPPLNVNRLSSLNVRWFSLEE